MSSNSRVTHSKGPAEEVSLPPYTRTKKDVHAEVGVEKTASYDQAGGLESQQDTADNPSPFARPGSWAGTSSAPADAAGMLPASANPFAQPDSCTGSAQLDITPPKMVSPTARFQNVPGSPISSISGPLFQQDVNSSNSWDLIDPDTDTEVANITNELSQQQVGQLGTLYNQDFFVADTTGRRLSQVTDKTSYPYRLPNGNAALQLRLPDLLIYLKTDTYLLDANTGHHYAMYNNRIEKMSVLPKLYSAWPYKQLLQSIRDDAIRFGVNSPEPTTSEAPVPQQPAAVPDASLRLASQPP
ncbi:MAG: hypothetical protein MPJ22_00940 [Pirellulales bacterium]|nr:hypothetical protein [Pirellulales bacterium]